ncbi:MULTISPECIES: divergent PAP2 family protein [Anaerotruncus]|uniref:Divergent PAP2 family protein n=2 Tax=Anaerotruncus TaxID=244127 RepID=A0A498CQN0_9FIRM|nr:MULTISPECIES: divergent PAP2 family protein [Anaerotruncus]MBC3937445.1 divergent PAP2 family protein [Anaerotruncus massiliensis (ex Togo et al. 2019)]MCQ4894518.1 divergent PAP2 family protein [Anaerotruncus sp. DFI.9.16]RLL14565.1 divergent PAP2 family protein [Anaerotruncus massiliensis (ex Liu et al. 2021)]GKH46965.1 membrane protein [Oscillospiraceae bacterium]
MNPLRVLISNYVIDVGFLAWFAAQLLKTILAYIPSRKIIWERMVGSGGMPSSHSALVCAVSVGVAKKLGYASPEFALSLAMAGIVMYDAMGVRRAAGEQAKVLNKMVIDFKEIFQMLKEEFDALARGEDAPEERGGPNKRLKEFLGHTPLEVLCGAALGILIAALIPAF